jgi:hypothetical protein
MKESKKTWFSENSDAILTREKLKLEIHRIKGLKAPLKKRILEIRYLIEDYFKLDSNEEFLNANLP